MERLWQLREQLFTTNWTCWCRRRAGSTCLSPLAPVTAARALPSRSARVRVCREPALGVAVTPGAWGPRDAEAQLGVRRC